MIFGGGSLDMVTIKGGRTGKAHTPPFGPLRLMDQARGDLDKARDLVDKGLARIGDLSAPAHATPWAASGAVSRASRHGGA